MSLAEAAAKHLSAYQDTVSTGKELKFAPKEELDGKIRKLSDGVASFYLPKAVFFGMPEFTVFDTPTDVADTLNHVSGLYFTKGLGFDLRPKSHRIEVVCEAERGVGTAACFVKWTYHPSEKSGFQPWDVDILYGFRKRADGTAGWEYCVIDGELTEMLKRVPDLFDDGKK
ncbi:hypothetical protein NA57DRAFT_58657 [Rhizodiscina lignyota]|uniref:Uncharacterized protein n=1 Tax=Rhizodiscina lignyota TaxID=1504668 RepID=A0A9P4ID17_9PEZI|nr:hypothetical protein NA57DRAFT_58657 [Rhizodiscina lignyota]